MECLNDYSPFISSLCVLLAFGFSIFVYIQTRRLLKPLEHPILSIIKQEAKTVNIIRPAPGIQIMISSRIKNIGKHSANNLDVWVGMSQIDKLEKFKIKHTSSSANRIDFNGEFNFRQSETIIRIEKGEAVLFPAKTKFYIYLLLTYEDAFKPKKKDKEYGEYWLTYITGEKGPAFATKEEKSKLEPYVKPLKEKILKGDFLLHNK